MALAGLWENWHSPAGEWVRSFAVITTTPNELCAELHNRMPAVLKPGAWPVWLGEESADSTELKAFACAVSLGRDDMLAGERAGRQCEERRPESDRTDCCLGRVLIPEGAANRATAQR